jgi:hypothetical protein
MSGGVGVTERVAKTTIEEWARKVSEETEKHLILIALLKKKGRIEYGCSGGQFRWIVRIKDHELNGFPDGQPVSFTRQNTKENAYLPWRGYYAQDTITLREKLEQGGPEAMVKVFANREETIRRGVMRRLAQEMFKDGNTTANTALETFHGIESCMGIGAQTASSIIASIHDDTYAGLNTVVGGVSGSTTENERVWTPVIMNTNHTPSGGSQQTWENFADEYIRDALLRATYGVGPDDRPDLILLNQLAYKQLLNLMDDKERIPVSRGAGLALTQLGFGNTVELDGCAITWDASVPSTDAAPYGSDGVTMQGYGFTTGRMKLKVLGGGSKQLFESRVTFNDSYRADNIFMHLLGNLMFESPRHFIKFAEISGVAS